MRLPGFTDGQSEGRDRHAFRHIPSSAAVSPTAVAPLTLPHPPDVWLPGPGYSCECVTLSGGWWRTCWGSKSQGYTCETTKFPSLGTHCDCFPV